MRPPPRLCVEGPLAADSPLALSTDQAHYLRHVLRLGPGAPVLLFNGRDGEWRAVLDSLDKARATARPETRTRPQAEDPGPWLLFAPLKKDAMDVLVQKAVELGCGALWPVFTRRSQTQRVRTDRLAAQVREAAEQCERLTLPEVHEARPLERALSAWPAERRLIVLAERRDAPPLAEALGATTGPPPGLLVGPEGGLDDLDLDLVSALIPSWSPRSDTADLGPRILRAETAALAALAVWQALAPSAPKRPAAPPSQLGLSPS